MRDSINRPLPGLKPTGTNVTTWTQRQISLAPRRRGFHLVTDEILRQVPDVREFGAGFLHLFIQHTSASLTLNENASAAVLDDFEAHFNAAVPEEASYWTHVEEGTDDMPAHVKASVFGSGLLIPVHQGNLATGTWQGIYLCEHRNEGGRRRIFATLFGEKR
jgi:secondary thiamine-phosphate synthase enzyme